MDKQEGIVKGDAFQKMGSAGFIIATVLIIVANTSVATIDLSNPVVARARMSGQRAILDTITLMITCAGARCWWKDSPKSEKGYEL